MKYYISYSITIICIIYYINFIILFIKYILYIIILNIRYIIILGYISTIYCNRGTHIGYLIISISIANIIWYNII